MDPLFSLHALAALAFGYLLGSIPFGLILTRAAGLGDVRKIGSGNIGATNVLRTGNKGLAALTLILDALKGTAAVLIAKHIGGQHGMAIVASMLAGLGAFLGHVYPVWLGFKGGKGVATYIGVLLGAFWPAAAVFCLTWLVLAAATRYSSLSALVAAVVTPAVLLAFGDHLVAALVPWVSVADGIEAWSAGLLGVPLSALLLWKHKANIERLLRGQEPKIGAKA